MRFYSPKYRYDPNAMVQSLYHGIAPGGQTVTKIVKLNADKDQLEATRTYEPGIPRGQGGNIGTFIIGGMVTTLDEMKDICEAAKEKKFVPRKSNKEVADMCRHLLERRNDTIKYYRKNPSEAPKKPKVQLYLPVGCHYKDTPEPGLKILARV